jgi:hypothetical protein
MVVHSLALPQRWTQEESEDGEEDFFKKDKKKTKEKDTFWPVEINDISEEKHHLVTVKLAVFSLSLLFPLLFPSLPFLFSFNYYAFLITIIGGRDVPTACPSANPPPDHFQPPSAFRWYRTRKTVSIKNKNNKHKQYLVTFVLF